MTPLNPTTAMAILAQCRGDEIWSIETCRQANVPEVWIEELVDAHESGFDNDRNTIYERGQLVNHYHGVADLALAIRVAEFLGIDTSLTLQSILGRRAQVNALKEEIDEI
ncbi:MAG: hypothetical protein MK106_14520 [Mariniblastus sp.]|nr:hypothetical protein [Mariniblastus sp.]